MILFALMLFTPAALHGVVINVPADYPTIQEAIDAATHGDIVLVAPGTYVENINYQGKDIVVKSTHGPEVTVIDGGNPPSKFEGSCVTFNLGEGPDAVLEGFTLTNGKGNYIQIGFGFTHGGGICCTYGSSPVIRGNIIAYNDALTDKSGRGGGIAIRSDCAPEIRDNIIERNEADYGGGIYVYGSSPLITGNVISENTARYIEPNDGGRGGGIYIRSSTYEMTGNVITKNTAAAVGGGIDSGSDNDHVIAFNIIAENSAGTATVNGSGGGVYLFDPDFMTFTNNVIASNKAGVSGYTGNGGGIYCYSEYAGRVAGNLIYGNHANTEGGGIMFRYYADGEVVNNTICENIALENGGGIYIEIGSEMMIVNTILWDNSAVLGEEIYLESQASYLSELSISYSDVDGGQSSVHVEPSGTLDWGTGMMDSDPLFVEAAENDFHILYPSPCRDAGDNSVVDWVGDCDGNPRIAFDTVDIGSDEFYKHLYYTGSATPGGSIKVKIIDLPGTAPVGLLLGSGVLDPPAQTAWGPFHLQAPWLMLTLMPIPADGILIIPATIGMSPPAPYDIPMQALVGQDPDSLTDLCVLEVR
jgi:hypothetical protein